MNPELRDEIARVAYGLYVQSGREEGKDLINWLAAEKIVLGRLAGENAGAIRDVTPARQGGRKRRTPS